VNVLRVISVVKKVKNMTSNPKDASIIMNFKRKKVMLKNGEQSNLKRGQKNLENIETKLIRDGVKKTPSAQPSGTVLMLTPV